MKGTTNKVAILGLSLVLGASFCATAVFGFAATGLAPLFKDNLIVTTEDLTDIYTGEEIDFGDSEIEVSSGMLAPGDYIVEEPVTKTYKDAGTYKNRVNFKIYDINGQDVTRQYNISRDYGDIIINQRQLEISLNSDVVDPSYVETGDWLSGDELIVEGDGLCPNHSLSARVTKEEKGGSYEFKFSPRVVDENGNNVTSNYVNKINISFSNLPDIDFPPIEEWGDKLPPVNIDLDDFDFDNTFEDLLDEIPGIENLDFDIFGFTAPRAGLYYFRGTSYGDYNGSGFDVATPYTGTTTVNPLEFSSQFYDKDPLTMTIRLSKNIESVNYDVVPYFAEFPRKNGNDIAFSIKENREDSYGVLYNYDLLPQLRLKQIQNETFKRTDTLYYEERSYREFVEREYLNVDDYLESQLNGFILEHEMTTTDVAKFTDELTNIFYEEYEAKWEGLGSSNSSISDFLLSTKAGNAENFASAATMLYRTIGVPARYVKGYFAPCKGANELTVVKAYNQHAWTEIYINGHGWIPVDFVASLILNEAMNPDDGIDDPSDTGLEDDNNYTSGKKFADSDYLFDITVEEPGTYYLKEESLGSINSNFGLDGGPIYSLNGDKPNPNEFLGKQISNGYASREITITYPEGSMREKDLAPSYYAGDGGLSATNDLYYLTTDTTRTSYTVLEYEYDYYSDPDFLDSIFFWSSSDNQAEELYSDFAISEYKDINPILKATIQDKIYEYTPTLPTDPYVILSTIVKYVSEIDGITYEPLVEYNKNYQPGDTIEEILMRQPAKVDSSLVSIAAMLLFRSLDVPCRVASGYLYEADKEGTAAITEYNRYFWNEIYFKDHGWVRVDITKYTGILDDKYNKAKNVISVTSDAIDKEYDGKTTYSEPRVEGTVVDGDLVDATYITTVNGTTIDENGEIAPVENEIFVFAEGVDGQDVMYKYAFKYNLGTITVRKKQLDIYLKNIEEIYEQGLVLSPEIDYVSCDGFNFDIENDFKYEILTTLSKKGEIQVGEEDIEIVAIYDEDGMNILDYFDIRIHPGKLVLK